MSNKPILGGINSILRKQREEATGTKSVAGPVNDVRPQDEQNDLSKNSEHINRDNAPLPVVGTVQIGSNLLRDLESPQSGDLTGNSDLPAAKLDSHNQPSSSSTVPLHENPPNSSAKKYSKIVKDKLGVYEAKTSAFETFSLGDHVLKFGLAGNELRLYEFIYRQTIVLNQPSCRLNIKDLQRHLGLTQMSVFRILNRLEAKQAIRRKKLEQHRLLIGIELSLVF